jgi:hypothetical protein
MGIKYKHGSTVLAGYFFSACAVLFVFMGGNDMYEMVKAPKKRIKEKWLDQAFAPLHDYLEREHPETKHQIMGYLMFMYNEDGKFCYKNSMTRTCIIFNQKGDVISLDKSALDYQFDDWFGPRGEFKALEDFNIHPNVSRWIKGNLNKSEIINYGLTIKVLLQELWGPVVNYDFSDLKVGYPLRRFRLPYCLYIYPSKFKSLIAFQFVGDEIVERRCTCKQYDDYLMAGNDLTIAGWKGITITPKMLERISSLKNIFPQFIDKAGLRDPFINY